jgi:diaminohydroxyphosphoribosylaminopyrimidine deaminase/5-amino-6-(5-phosphoribosylamino)uracil reductase
MPHAEVEAITDARGHYADRLPGATLYVTLEPCSSHGRTPPCTDAITASGVRRVVWGAQDPNPKHEGRAIELLARAGIPVTTGVLESECRDLIRPFAKWITTSVPYVIAKAGQSLDGRITRPPGEGQWLTNEAARAHGRRLRAQVDAIIIGAETLRQDNPKLTLRDQAQPGKQQPWRVILTRTGNLPEQAHVFTDSYKDRTLIMRDLSFPDVLGDLGRRGVVSVLVEGGGNVLAQAFRHRAVDEVYWYVAPILCGIGIPTLADAWDQSVTLEEVQFLPFGDNMCIHGRPAWPNKTLDKA